MTPLGRRLNPRHLMYWLCCFIIFVVAFCSCFFFCYARGPFPKRVASIPRSVTEWEWRAQIIRSGRWHHNRWIFERVQSQHLDCISCPQLLFGGQKERKYKMHNLTGMACATCKQLNEERILNRDLGQGQCLKRVRERQTKTKEFPLFHVGRRSYDFSRFLLVAEIWRRIGQYLYCESIGCPCTRKVDKIIRWSQYPV